MERAGAACHLFRMVALNHTIVFAKSQRESAQFYADILGLAPPKRFAVFLTVELANGLTLDFDEMTEPFPPTHYAFLVSDAEFDAAFGRIKSRGVAYQADPMGQLPMQTNTHDGGRGVYFRDPSGHLLELITVPYGGWPK